MNLRSRVFFVTAICSAIVVTFGMVTHFTFEQNRHLQKEIAKSYQLIELAIGYNDKQLKDIQEKIQSLSQSLNPEFRTKTFADFLKRPHNSELRHLLKAEIEYRNHTQNTIAYLDKRMRYFGALGLVSSLLACLGLSIFTVRLVFNPIHSLSHKMKDFLDNKYSYQFTVPAENEIGHLHSTFNLMAQKVLARIEDLKSLDKAKSEFLSIASHELRTPLTSIKGSLSLLQGGVVGSINKATKDLIVIALSETDRLIRIINELLDLAKIEARQFPLKKEWLNARQLAKKTFDGLQGLAHAAEIPLELGEFMDCEIHVDADRLQQVLANLLSNAIKFSPAKKPVTLSLIPTDGALSFEVRDLGRGISPADQELIFEKFRQATSVDNPLVKGTGLGLTIAKALVEQHGGQIGVRSRPGEGSTFYFSIAPFRPVKNREVA